MSTYEEHFNKELNILRKKNPNVNLIIDKYEQVFRDALKVFGDEDHSGASAHREANYITDALKRTLLFGILSPLSGVDDEWMDVGEDEGVVCFQNKRLSSVFKEGVGGRPYYIDALIFKEENRSCWTGSCLHKGRRLKSRAYIKDLGVVPKPIYVNVRSVEVNPDDWEFYLDDSSQLDEVEKYYDLIYVKEDT